MNLVGTLNSVVTLDVPWVIELDSFPGLFPPSPLRMIASDNYAWVYWPGTFYHVMRAATVIKRHRVVL